MAFLSKAFDFEVGKQVNTDSACGAGGTRVPPAVLELNLQAATLLTQIFGSSNETFGRAQAALLAGGEAHSDPAPTVATLSPEEIAARLAGWRAVEDSGRRTKEPLAGRGVKLVTALLQLLLLLAAVLVTLAAAGPASSSPQP